MKDSAIITMVQLVDPTGNGVDAVRRMPKFFEEAKEKGRTDPDLEWARHDPRVRELLELPDQDAKP